MTGLRTLFLTEARLLRRDVANIAFVLALPIVIYLVFGLPEFARQPDPIYDGRAAIDAFFPSLSLLLAFGMIGFFSVPAYLGEYRSKGVLRRLSTTPLNPLALLAVQLVLNLLLALAALLLVVGAAVFVLDRPAPQSVAWLGLAVLLGAAALFSIGLVVAAIAPSAKAAQTIGHLPFWPSAFLAGVWIPKEAMPDQLSRIGDFTPLSAFRDAAQAAWLGDTPEAVHLLVLVATTLIAGGLASKIFRWE